MMADETEQRLISRGKKRPVDVNYYNNICTNK